MARHRRARNEREQRHDVQGINWLLLELQRWENLYELIGWENQVRIGLNERPFCSNQAGVRNWPHFRDYLLRFRQGTTRHQLLDFAPPSDFPKELADYQARLPSYQEDLTLWQRNSRRIFRIDEDLRLLLGTTSINNVRWASIQLPFDAFAIEFVPPLEMTDAFGVVCEYHTMLVITFGGNSTIPGRHIRLRLLGKARDRPLQDTINQRERAEMEDLIRRHCFGQARHLLTKLQKTAGRCGIGGSFFESPMPQGDELATNVAQEIWKLYEDGPFKQLSLFEQLQYMVRLLVGFCLYLKTPKGASQTGPARKPYRRRHPEERDALVNDWEVCDVQSIIALTNETRQILAARDTWRNVDDAQNEQNEEDDDEQQQKRRSPIAHFRRGTWVFPKLKEVTNTEGEAQVVAPEHHWRSPSFVCPWNLPKEAGLPLGALAVRQSKPPGQ